MITENFTRLTDYAFTARRIQECFSLAVLWLKRCLCIGENRNSTAGELSDASGAGGHSA